jgi:hypothetical protein
LYSRKYPIRKTAEENFPNGAHSNLKSETQLKIDIAKTFYCVQINLLRWWPVVNYFPSALDFKISK